MFIHSGDRGVQLIINPENRHHLQDVFVMEAPGPRSAYFIPAVHASMIAASVSAELSSEDEAAGVVDDDSPEPADVDAFGGEDGPQPPSIIDYGGWILETLSPVQRAGASPYKNRDLTVYKHGHPPSAGLFSPMASQQQRSFTIGDTVPLSGTGAGSLLNGTLIGYIDPSSGSVYTRPEDAPDGVIVQPLLVDSTALRVEGLCLFFGFPFATLLPHVRVDACNRPAHRCSSIQWSWQC